MNEANERTDAEALTARKDAAIDRWARAVQALTELQRSETDLYQRHHGLAVSTLRGSVESLRMELNALYRLLWSKGILAEPEDIEALAEQYERELQTARNIRALDGRDPPSLGLDERLVLKHLDTPAGIQNLIRILERNRHILRDVLGRKTARGSGNSQSAVPIDSAPVTPEQRA